MDRLEPGLSVVIPVYNNASGVEPLLERLVPVLEEIGRPWEVVLVNDGSADDSWGAIEAAVRGDGRVRGFDLLRNYGQHNALLCGVRAARRELIVTMDDDLQNPPEELPRLLDALEAGSLDLVYGTSVERQHGALHNLGAAGLRFVMGTVLGAEVARTGSPYRVFRTRVRDGFRHNETPWVVLDALIVWTTTRIGSVTVRHDQALNQETRYSLWRRVLQAFDVMTGFSTIPLRFASLLGLLFTVFGFGVFVYVVGSKVVFDQTAPGWAFISSTVAILGGAQLFALGIIGEYLARVFLATMGRPGYTIGRSTDQDQVS